MEILFTVLFFAIGAAVLYFLYKGTKELIVYCFSILRDEDQSAVDKAGAALMLIGAFVLVLPFALMVIAGLQSRD